jgi:streptogramin lyase
MRRLLKVIGSVVLCGAASWAVQGSVTAFPLAPQSGPSAICKGPDGALWFTEEGANQIGRITTTGSISQFTVPTPTAGVGGITTGPDGNLYFTEFKANKVGRFNPTTRQFTEWLLPQASAGPGGVVTGADANLWIMEAQASKIVRMTTAGTFLPAFTLTGGSWPHGPTLGPDGNVWFAEFKRNRIARITPLGKVIEFVLPQLGSNPDTVTTGLDGNIYFTENHANKIGSINFGPLPSRNGTCPPARHNRSASQGPWMGTCTSPKGWAIRSAFYMSAVLRSRKLRCRSPQQHPTKSFRDLTSISGLLRLP